MEYLTIMLEGSSYEVYATGGQNRAVKTTFSC